jgi:undecaprenyl-diphosphatase
MDTIQAIILAIIEGITEFLPVSSTGHMILGAALMGVKSDAFTKLFTVGIQFGAILSVVVLYWRQFLQSFSFYAKLGVAFIPAAIMGLVFKKYIDAAMESVTIVAINLLLGGIILLFVDKWFAQNENTAEGSNGKNLLGESHFIDNIVAKIPFLSENGAAINYTKAFFIGCFQTIAMLPGVSRSAATIIGGLVQGVNRKTAAEFSFFLAVPTMAAATLKDFYDFFKENGALTSEQWQLFGVGNVVAFIVAIVAIRSFIGLLTQYGFRFFGYYRIIVGVLILLLAAMGYELKLID